MPFIPWKYFSLFRIWEVTFQVVSVKSEDRKETSITNGLRKKYARIKVWLCHFRVKLSDRYWHHFKKKNQHWLCGSLSLKIYLSEDKQQKTKRWVKKKLRGMKTKVQQLCFRRKKDQQYKEKLVHHFHHVLSGQLCHNICCMYKEFNVISLWPWPIKVNTFIHWFEVKQMFNIFAGTSLLR